MRQYIKILFYITKFFIIANEDGTLSEESHRVKGEIVFPDVGDIEKTREIFQAAYSEAEIIEMSHIFWLDEKGKPDEL